MKLREGESQITQCVLEDAFTATLTNFRLIIESSISEESYPLAGITGIAVVDDVEGYAKKKNEIKHIKSKYIVLGASPGYLIFIIGMVSVSEKIQILLVVLFSIIGMAIGAYFGNEIFKKRFQIIELDSFLEIMQSGGTKRFSFLKTNDNARAIKEFVNRITDTMK